MVLLGTIDHCGRNSPDRVSLFNFDISKTLTTRIIYLNKALELFK